MPNFIFKYLESRSSRFHLLMALGLGLLFRLCSAYFAFGAQAIDDYTHAILPAYQMFAGLPVVLPDYRSPLLVWFLAGALHLGHAVGIQGPTAQIQWMLASLGVLSLSAVVGAYLYFRGKQEPVALRLSMYLVALAALMPYASTRAFGESVAIGLTLLGLGLCEWGCTQKKGFVWGFFGFIFLGLAVLFRFHVGIIFFIYAAALLYEKRFQLLIGGLFAGVSILILQTVADFSVERPFLGTLQNYLHVNSDGGAIHGVHPWYNTWLIVLGLFLFPFSLVFIRQLPTLWKNNWRTLIPFLVFVLLHSLNPHKEERFMYPIVGLALVYLASVWVRERNSSAARYIFTPAYAVFFGTILFLSSFFNSRVGAVETADGVLRNHSSVVFVDYQSLLGKSFLRDMLVRPPNLLVKGDPSVPVLATARRIIATHPEHSVFAFMTSAGSWEAEIRTLSKAKGPGYACDHIVAIESMIDRFLRELNPRRNGNRVPSWYVVCQRT